MASAFFRSRWAAALFLFGGAALIGFGYNSRPLLIIGLIILFFVGFPLYNYFSFKGLCQSTEGKGVLATFWRSMVPFYGFIVYDPLEEEDSQARYGMHVEQRRKDRAARRAALRPPPS